MKRTNVVRRAVLLGACLAALGAAPPENRPSPMPRVKVDPSGRGFVLEPSGRPFVPWGVNYDHDEKSRLLEDYWEAEWAKVEEDLGEIRDLGANVVRIHLQVNRFLRSPTEPNPAALERLGRLLALAEKLGLYLDLTGLGCYRKADTPAWYDALDEPGRWAAQATFWKAVAGVGRKSPAVFCYDLMNEPVVPGGKRKPGDWLGSPFGEFCFVQFVTLDQADRPRPRVARLWVEAQARAVREADPGHLVTVGLVPWSLDRPGLTSGFEPKEVSPALDFVCVHLYPERNKLDDALATLRGFRDGAGGKPLLVEETFPLSCSADDLRTVMRRAHEQGLAAGWVGFYWGKTLDQYRPAKTISDALTAAWLELFKAGPPR